MNLEQSVYELLSEISGYELWVRTLEPARITSIYLVHRCGWYTKLDNDGLYGKYLDNIITMDKQHDCNGWASASRTERKV